MGFYGNALSFYSDMYTKLLNTVIIEGIKDDDRNKIPGAGGAYGS